VECVIFQERAAALSATFQRSPAPRYLVADAKLSQEDNAAHLRKLGFITRIPNTLKVVSQVMPQALTWDMWPWLEETTRYPRLALCHDRLAQRWLAVSSQAALERAEAYVKNACQRADEAIEKQRFHVQAQRFETPEAAQAALDALAKPWKYPQVDPYHRIEHPHDARPGRPTPTTPMKSIDWEIQVQVRPDQAQIEHRT
jgi:hypothetical protein